MSDVSLQDVSFAPGDDLEMTKWKLRVMQEEVLRLAQALSQFAAVDQESQALNLGAPILTAAAATPASTSGFINVTVNGQPYRLALFP